MKIPKGKVKTYKEVAIGIKMPKSARAVANACGKTPYSPKVPCHRVIRSDGTLGGFSGHGGIKSKKKLLRKEGFSHEKDVNLQSKSANQSSFTNPAFFKIDIEVSENDRKI